MGEIGQMLRHRYLKAKESEPDHRGDAKVTRKTKLLVNLRKMMEKRTARRGEQISKTRRSRVNECRSLASLVALLWRYRLC